MIVKIILYICTKNVTTTVIDLLANTQFATKNRNILYVYPLLLVYIASYCTVDGQSGVFSVP
jgi:hypothetical protein